MLHTFLYLQRTPPIAHMYALICKCLLVQPFVTNRLFSDHLCIICLLWQTFIRSSLTSSLCEPLISTTQKRDTILVLKALISVLEPSLNKAYPVVSTQTICKRSTVMHSPSCWNPKPKSTCRLLNSTGGPNLNKASVAVAIQSREESHKGHHFLPFPCLSKPTPSLKKKKGD